MLDLVLGFIPPRYLRLGARASKSPHLSRFRRSRGADQALGEIGGLISRDCAEPAPGDPTLTDCGFTYAGDCGEFAPEQACKHFAPHDVYRTCYAAPIGEAEARPFREVITVYVMP